VEDIYQAAEKRPSVHRGGFPSISRLVRLRIKTLPQERPKVLYSSGFRLPVRSPASRSLAEGRRFGEGRDALSATGEDIFDQPYKSCFFSSLF